MTPETTRTAQIVMMLIYSVAAALLSERQATTMEISRILSVPLNHHLLDFEKGLVRQWLLICSLSCLMNMPVLKEWWDQICGMDTKYEGSISWASILAYWWN